MSHPSSVTGRSSLFMRYASLILLFSRFLFTARLNDFFGTDIISLLTFFPLRLLKQHLNPPAKMYFPSLKSLCMSFFKYIRSDLRNFLSGGRGTSASVFIMMRCEVQAQCPCNGRGFRGRGLDFYAQSVFGHGLCSRLSEGREKHALLFEVRV